VRTRQLHLVIANAGLIAILLAIFYVMYFTLPMHDFIVQHLPVVPGAGT
jgi:hypothetical protein